VLSATERRISNAGINHKISGRIPRIQKTKVKTLSGTAPKITIKKLNTPEPIIKRPLETSIKVLSRVEGMKSTKNLKSLEMLERSSNASAIVSGLDAKKMRKNASSGHTLKNQSSKT